MNSTMRDVMANYLDRSVSAFGFAPVNRFDEAPEKHHPSNIYKGAKTVVVFGIEIPRVILQSPDYNLHALYRSYHTVYRRLDEISLELCNLIESQGRFAAVMVPSYAPMVFHEFEP